MIIYSCPCLNIQLYAQPPSQHLDTENISSCPIGSDIELVELVDQGFHCAQKCLVHQSKSGTWMVCVCILCKTPTHAVDREANIVAVSTSMRKGKSFIDNMRQTDDFSSVFGLLLNQNEEKGKNDVCGQTYESVQQHLMDIQSVISGFLRQEEDAMELRIRKYEEEQRAKFESVKESCLKEKTKITGILLSSLKHQENQFTSGDQPHSEVLRHPNRSHAPVSQSKSDGIPEKRHSRPLSGTLDATPEKRHSRPLSGSSSRRSRDSRDLSPDDVFAMDDFEAILDAENDNSPRLDSSPRNSNSPRQGRASGQSPFSTLEQRLRQEQDRNNSNSPQSSSSRSRSRGKDIPPLVEGGASSSHHTVSANQQRTVLSSSVPISMPVMSARGARNSSNFDDDIDEESTDFDDIPRHMQALSESIQERDRYIFGDRPRQRVNTGDFTQINWR